MIVSRGIKKTNKDLRDVLSDTIKNFDASELSPSDIADGLELYINTIFKYDTTINLTNKVTVSDYDIITIVKCSNCSLRIRVITEKPEFVIRCPRCGKLIVND